MNKSITKRHTTEHVDIIFELPDLRAECDRCHHEAPLILDHTTEGQGDFAYCKTCFKASKHLRFVAYGLSPGGPEMIT